MLTNFIRGITAYFRAMSFISSRGLSRYFFYSGVIGLILFGICGFLVYSIAPALNNWTSNLLPWDFAWIESLTQWLFYGVSGLLFISIFKYLMLIFTAPLMSSLSEKVEQELSGYEAHKTPVLRILKEIIRGLRINIRNIIREILLTLVILLLGFIPVIGLISAALIILVQSYYAGFGNYDFWAERHFSYRETVRFMKANKGMLAGNGIVYVFLLAIPVLGAFIAPPLATVAATMEGFRELEEYY